MAKQKKRYKRLSRSRGGDIALIIFLILFTILMMIPLFYGFLMSLKPASELWKFPPTLWPQNPTLKNYKDILNVMTETWVPIERYLFNSLLYTISGTIGHIVLGSMAAYPLSRYRFPGSKGIFKLIRSSLMFSGAVLAIPNYLIMNGLGLIDNYMAVILPTFAGTLGLFLMKQFMDQMIPMPLLESAEIDGAGEWAKFSKIVMPLVKPAWLTLIIFDVKDLWQQGASAYIYDEPLKTLPYALGQITSSGIARAGIAQAISVIMWLPPLLVFIISQSHVIETMATSGMKD